MCGVARGRCGCSLVAHDADDRYFAGECGSPAVALFGEFGVKAFQNSLRHTRWMAEPYRCADEQNIRVEHLPAELRPLVAVPHIRRDSRSDVVIGAAL